LKEAIDAAMSDPRAYDSTEQLAPVHVEDYQAQREGWAGRLILFLRAVAALSLVKGLYHWAVICGFGLPAGAFEARSLSWQVATVFFAIIDLIAAVGLWLSAPWGVIIWLASSVTMVIVQTFFPQIYGFQLAVVALEVAVIGLYGFIAFKAAREQPD
jgi:hypothetical protein